MSRGSLLRFFLWWAVLRLALWVGGTVFNILVIVPLWAGAPPERRHGVPRFARADCFAVASGAAMRGASRAGEWCDGWRRFIASRRNPNMEGRRAKVLGVALGVLLGGVATAQEKPGDIAIVYSVKAKDGAWMQLDAAMKNHLAWHRAQNDAYAWFVWQVISGEDIGDYVVGTFDHRWRELDGRAKFDEADEADFVANVMPAVAKVDLGYWTFLRDLSLPRGEKPATMAHVTHYFVRPGGFAPFLDALKQFKAASEKAGYPFKADWYRLVSGGEGPQFVLVRSYDTWAELEPPAKSFDQAIAETLGASKFAALEEAVREATRLTRSYTIRHRADLSYVPATSAPR